MAKILKDNLGEAAARVPVKELPNTLLRIAALKDPVARSMIPFLGKVMNVASAKAIRMLNWSPRSREEAVLATAESLIRLHLLDQ